MTYSCTNQACGWRGTPDRPVYNWNGELTCPCCSHTMEDLDFLERAAIREIDGEIPREDAERLAREDLEKWEAEP